MKKYLFVRYLTNNRRCCRVILSMKSFSTIVVVEKQIQAVDTDRVSVLWDVTEQRSASCWRTVDNSGRGTTQQPGGSNQRSLAVRESSRDSCSWGRWRRRRSLSSGAAVSVTASLAVHPRVCRGDVDPVPSSSGWAVLMSPPVRRTEVLQPQTRVLSPLRTQTGSLGETERKFWFARCSRF